MAAPVLRPLTTGEVLDVSIGLYRSLFAPLVIVALVTRVVPTVMAIYLQSAGGLLLHPWLTLLNLFLTLALAAVGVAASTFIVSGAYLGETVNAEQALQRTVPLIWPLVLLHLMVAVVVVMGFVLFIVPGILFLSGLLVCSVALVLERPLAPTAAMNRSWELTKGFRGKVLLVVLTLFVLFAVPSAVVVMVTGIVSLAGPKSPVLFGVLNGALSVFLYPFAYVAVTVLYYDLRVRKEGFDLELLGAATQPA
jgi:hypothetical protein